MELQPPDPMLRRGPFDGIPCKEGVWGGSGPRGGLPSPRAFKSSSKVGNFSGFPDPGFITPSWGFAEAGILPEFRFSRCLDFFKTGSF